MELFPLLQTRHTSIPILTIMAVLVLFSRSLFAQVTINQNQGVDQGVDYRNLELFGPWDDRNYDLTRADLALLPPDDSLQSEAIPAFYRVQLRREQPQLRRSGPAQYPRSGLPRFLIAYGGYLYNGQLYQNVFRSGRRFIVDTGGPSKSMDAFADKTTAFVESRVTNPNGAAESAVAYNPVNPDIVIAGSNGPGSGQRMHYSTDGGTTWSFSANSGALPLGSTCCDPTVAWSSDGTKAYTATLGSNVWFYRSSDGGQTWTDLESITPGDPRRELGAGVDKEYLHVDTYPTSPHLDNIYMTWHQGGNVMQFARSTDMGNTWSTLSFPADPRGIGSDITTDKSGNVYYFWPAFSTKQIILKKSTDGGVSFGAASVVASTQGSFIFPIPSMETREVFIYVSADTDRSNGPFANSIYAAWTDAAGATTNMPSNNHARIVVAYSRDGGATWNTSIPHETADAATVDRWHQWLAVASNGDVHVIFYDTRQDLPNRNDVDLYHSVSTDGGVTWSVPDRVTTASSPNIANGFEFGDYNGMDVIANNLISIFTDNRSEGGGNTVDVYSASTLIDIGGIDISLKAFLQGPYDVTGDTMETDLAQADLIPQQQPYNTAPWNYTGLEMIPGPTPLNIVDWVLVRLRTTTAAASIVATQAALLRNDGMIVAPDGTPMLNFVGLNDPNYYVEIIHRNHLNILSKNAVAVASKAPMLYGQLTYDFTTALTQVFGDDQRLLDTGVYGMYAGDLNSNNEIRYIGTGRDQLEIINVLGTSNLASTENGYYRADANLNGIVRYIGATRDQEPIIAVLGSSNLGSTKTSNVPN